MVRRIVADGMERPRGQLGTQTETLGKRIVALIVDAVIIGVVTAVISLILALASARFAGLGGLLGGIITFAYFIYMEGAYGQTIGKKLMNIVVVTEAGGDCDMTDSAIRNVLRVVDGLFAYLVGLVVIILTEENQRIGDIVGDTLVVEVAADSAEAPHGSRAGSEPAKSTATEGAAEPTATGETAEPAATSEPAESTATSEPAESPATEETAESTAGEGDDEA